jgi:hypothetical protein
LTPFISCGKFLLTNENKKEGAMPTKPKKAPAKTAPTPKTPVKKVDNTKRNELYFNIFVALCSNPNSPLKGEELVFMAQSLTQLAIEGSKKEIF